VGRSSPQQPQAACAGRTVALKHTTQLVRLVSGAPPLRTSQEATGVRRRALATCGPRMPRPPHARRRTLAVGGERGGEGAAALSHVWASDANQACAAPEPSFAAHMIETRSGGGWPGGGARSLTARADAPTHYALTSAVAGAGAAAAAVGVAAVSLTSGAAAGAARWEKMPEMKPTIPSPAGAFDSTFASSARFFAR